MNTRHWLLLANLASTWGMVGLIWFVQIVHYPLFAKVGEPNFATYEEIHQRLTTLVVLPLMFTELLTAAFLVFYPPEGINKWVVVKKKLSY